MASLDAATHHPDVAQDGLTILFDNTPMRGPRTVEFGVDIVFIHGLNGHAKNTWCHSNGFFWPFELREVLKQSRVMMFGYNCGIQSDFASNFIRIKGIAALLNGALVNVRANELQLHRPLVFVCHSMGGLVAKAALVAMAKASVTKVNDLHHLHDSVRGFIFFGTPHGGSSVLGKNRVNILKKICQAAFMEIPPKLEDALEAGSDEVLDLAEDFRNTRPFVEQKILIATYYEQLGTPGLSGQVVTEMEANIAYPKANPPEPINADHRGMVRFAELGSGNAANPVGLLTRWETKLKYSGIHIRGRLHSVLDISELSLQPEWHIGFVIPADQDHDRTANFAFQLQEGLEESKIRIALRTSRATESAPPTNKYEVALASFMQGYGDELVQQVDIFHSSEQQTGLFKAMLRLTKGNLDADTETLRTLMHWLAMNGNARLLPKLQEVGFDVEARDSDRRTPLHLAVIANHFEAVRILLEECHANPHAKDLRKILPFNYSLRIDLDNASDSPDRLESRRRIIRLLAENTDPGLVTGSLAVKAITVLRENLEADIVIM
ncbi:Alpha/Beta hydrolase protein [Chaetomium sp. MPI-CAGE-AT-0009]|nr:Alpha/Beta hydrolase protein [Chaetomium sp. MPI-CAGE-AT-0009]